MKKDALKEVCHSFINGHYIQNQTTDLIYPNIYPGTNQTINQLEYTSEDLLEKAVTSSYQAFNLWKQTSLNHRSSILLKAASLLRERVAKIAALEVWDTGKPISETLAVDIHSAADCLEYFAKIVLAYEDNVMPNHHALIYTMREPLGVCVGIGAWNYPLQIACWKAAPALIMGNTMIYKPSELTPMSVLALAEIFQEAGLPSGVFNVVLGDGAVAEKLLRHHHIAKISFTGSIPTGKKILQQAAHNLVPVTLELGGKSPLIIFDDANVEQAILGSMLANFYSQGEICSNGTRVFVERSIYESFTDGLIERVKKLAIGDPFDLKTQVGALISRQHMKNVLDYIEKGKVEGAELIFGGSPVSIPPLDQGNFIKPAIFTGCHDDMAIVCDEIFGPVMSILIFDSEDEVIARANNTSYGLAAGIFTENIKRAHLVAKQLQAGVCWINNYNITPVVMPFGGCKKSGFGRENGITALSHYSQLKSVYVELNQIEHTYI